MTAECIPMDESIQALLNGTDDAKSQIRYLRQVAFWVDAALDFYNKFYIKEKMNCEVIRWTLYDSTLDLVMQYLPEIKKEFEEGWSDYIKILKKEKKEIKTETVLGDEFDLINSQKLLEKSRKLIVVKIKELELELAKNELK